MDESLYLVTSVGLTLGLLPGYASSACTYFMKGSVAVWGRALLSWHDWVVGFVALVWPWRGLLMWLVVRMLVSRYRWTHQHGVSIFGGTQRARHYNVRNKVYLEFTQDFLALATNFQLQCRGLSSLWGAFLL